MSPWIQRRNEIFCQFFDIRIISNVVQKKGGDLITILIQHYFKFTKSSTAPGIHIKELNYTHLNLGTRNRNGPATQPQLLLSTLKYKTDQHSDKILKKKKKNGILWLESGNRYQLVGKYMCLNYVS
jgi:hypothetical protein